MVFWIFVKFGVKLWPAACSEHESDKNGKGRNYKVGKYYVHLSLVWDNISADMYYAYLDSSFLSGSDHMVVESIMKLTPHDTWRASVLNCN